MSQRESLSELFGFLGGLNVAVSSLNASRPHKQTSRPGLSGAGRLWYRMAGPLVLMSIYRPGLINAGTRRVSIGWCVQHIEFLKLIAECGARNAQQLAGLHLVIVHMTQHFG